MRKSTHCPLPWPRTYKDGRTWRLIMADAWMGRRGCSALSGPPSQPFHVKPLEGLASLSLLACSDMAPERPSGSLEKGLSFQGEAKQQSIWWEAVVEWLLRVLFTGAAGEGKTAYSVGGGGSKADPWAQDPLSIKVLPKVTLRLIWGPVANEIRISLSYWTS